MRWQIAVIFWRGPFGAVPASVRSSPSLFNLEAGLVPGSASSCFTSFPGTAFVQISGLTARSRTGGFAVSVWCGPALRTALRPPRRASFLRYGNLLFCGFVIPFAAFRLCFCLNEAQEGYRIARKTTMHCQSMCCCGLCRPDGCGATVAGVEFFHEFCVQGVWSGPMPASIPCRSQFRGGRNPGPGRCAARNAFRWVAAGLASSPALLKGCGLFRPPLFAGRPALLASSPALLNGCGLFRPPLCRPAGRYSMW